MIKTETISKPIFIIHSRLSPNLFYSFFLVLLLRDLRQKSGPIAATARCAALAHMVMSAPATNFYAELYGETGLPPLHLKLGQMLGLRVELGWDKMQLYKI